MAQNVQVAFPSLPVLVFRLKMLFSGKCTPGAREALLDVWIPLPATTGNLAERRSKQVPHSRSARNKRVRRFRKSRCRTACQAAVHCAFPAIVARICSDASSHSFPDLELTSSVDFFSFSETSLSEQHHGSHSSF